MSPLHVSVRKWRVPTLPPPNLPNFGPVNIKFYMKLPWWCFFNINVCTSFLMLNFWVFWEHVNKVSQSVSVNYCLMQFIEFCHYVFWRFYKTNLFKWFSSFPLIFSFSPFFYFSSGTKKIRCHSFITSTKMLKIRASLPPIHNHPIFVWPPTLEHCYLASIHPHPWKWFFGIFIKNFNNEINALM